MAVGDEFVVLDGVDGGSGGGGGIGRPDVDVDVSVDSGNADTCVNVGNNYGSGDGLGPGGDVDVGSGNADTGVNVGNSYGLERPLMNGRNRNKDADAGGGRRMLSEFFIFTNCIFFQNSPWPDSAQADFSAPGPIPQSEIRYLGADPEEDDDDGREVAKGQRAEHTADDIATASKWQARNRKMASQ